MAASGSQEFELEDSFVEEEAASFEGDTTARQSATKMSLTKRRLIDDMLEEKRLQRRLKDYDFDLDEE